VWTNLTVDDFHTPYLYPSESGGRSDVEWVRLVEEGEEQQGVVLTYASGTSQMSLSRFHISELTKAAHQYELCPSVSEWRERSIKVILDHSHAGVGGDVSWLPSVHDEFKVTIPQEGWRFEIYLELVEQKMEENKKVVEEGV
jgi:beta-galactosidase